MVFIVTVSEVFVFRGIYKINFSHKHLFVRRFSLQLHSLNPCPPNLESFESALLKAYSLFGTSSKLFYAFRFHNCLSVFFQIFNLNTTLFDIELTYFLIDNICHLHKGIRVYEIHFGRINFRRCSKTQQ